MKFDLRKPCAHCPFRSDIRPYLHPERATELAEAIEGGATFGCHKTTLMDDDGEPYDGPETRHCAGALITQEREGRPNQMVRIAERLGLYEPALLGMGAPVYPSLSAWVAAHRGGS